MRARLARLFPVTDVPAYKERPSKKLAAEHIINRHRVFPQSTRLAAR
jgi:hypothetical protein